MLFPVGQSNVEPGRGVEKLGDAALSAIFYVVTTQEKCARSQSPDKLCPLVTDSIKSGRKSG
ncbi:MAG: hypothetical protein Q4A92_12295, partial [Corynebacterium sp.]|nr:hypothetical protein [Corynebacterium sp.]